MAAGQGLLNLFEHLHPQLVRDLRSGVELLARQPEDVAELSSLYEQLPQIDFSRDVLEVFSSSLRLVRVPACGWSDLGTPKRVAETLRRMAPHEVRIRHAPSENGLSISRSSMIDSSVCESRFALAATGCVAPIILPPRLRAAWNARDRLSNARNCSPRIF